MRSCHLSQQLLNFSVIAVLFAGGPAPSRAADTTPTGETELIDTLEHIRQRQHIPALALALVGPDGRQRCHISGIKNRQSGKAVTSMTQFRIGSITKTFTSLALLQLQERGRLKLGEPIDRYTPDAPIDNPWHTTNPVRIEHLLEHTAGFLDLTRAEFDSNDPSPLSLRDGLFFTDRPRRSMWPPGLHSSYSNAGAGYAAYILEQITGQKFEKYVVENLFKPLRMHSAGFFLDKNTQKQLATGYDSDGKTVIPYWHQTLRAYGAVNITPCEMGNLVQMLLDNGKFNGTQIVSAAAAARMETPRTTLAARSGLDYGYGLGNYQYVHKGFVFHGHGGDGDGYLAHFAYNRNVKAGYFLVINSFNKDALAELRDHVENFLLAGRTPTIVNNSEVRLSNKTMQALSGRYLPRTYRFSWNRPTENDTDYLIVGAAHGRLYTQFAGKKRVPLFAVNTRHFRRSTDPKATVAFIEHNGELYLQGDFGNYQRSVSPPGKKP